MKKITAFLLTITMILFLCSCGTEERQYSTYNPNIYYDMPQNEVDKILSEKYDTVNFGDKITYSISTVQDFMKIDPDVAVAPTVSYEFEDGRLKTISQHYIFSNGMPNSILDLYNTYLAIALGVDEVEIKQETSELDDGTVWNYISAAVYELENEQVYLISINDFYGNANSIFIDFSSNKKSF